MLGNQLCITAWKSVIIFFKMLCVSKPLTVEGAVEVTAQKNNCLCINTWRNNENVTTYGNLYLLSLGTFYFWKRRLSLSS